MMSIESREVEEGTIKRTKWQKKMKARMQEKGDNQQEMDMKVEKDVNFKKKREE